MGVDWTQPKRSRLGDGWFRECLSTPAVVRGVVAVSRGASANRSESHCILTDFLHAQTGAVSGMSGAPGLTGELAEIMVPFLDVLGDSVAFEYDPTAMATYAKKTGRTADLQAISMPFLDQYARTQLHLNGAPGYGGTYLSNKVTLSLIMQANTMAVVRTSATTADLYVGAWTV